MKDPAEQRPLWREVGGALNYGLALFPSNQGFGARCKAEGFDMDAAIRVDAMWWATHPFPDNLHTTAVPPRSLGGLPRPGPTPHLKPEPLRAPAGPPIIARRARKIHALANSA